MRWKALAGTGIGVLLILTSATSARAGGSGGGPPGGGGGVSGGGSGGGGALGNYGSCGPNRVLAVYDNQYWNGILATRPYASASQTSVSNPSDTTTFSQHVWPGYTKKDRSMVFLVDANNGYVWGPSDLSGYQPAQGTPPGEGYPPHASGPFGAAGALTISNNIPAWWNAGWEDWSCFDGGPPQSYDPAPINFLFGGLTHGGGAATIDNIGPGAQGLVWDPIRTSSSPVCPLWSDSPAAGSAYIMSALSIAGNQYPAPFQIDYTNSPSSTLCPNAGVEHGTSTPTGTWQWYDYQFPITSGTKIGGLGSCVPGVAFTSSPDVSACPPGALAFGPAVCRSGSGYLAWDWQPQPFVPSSLASKCTDGAGDSEVFEHVHKATVFSAPGTACTAAGCGVNVTLSERWGAYECLGAVRGGSHTWSWRLFTGQSMTYKFGDGWFFSYTCTDPNDAGFTQTYTTTPAVDIGQIESLPHG